MDRSNENLEREDRLPTVVTQASTGVFGVASAAVTGPSGAARLENGTSAATPKSRPLSSHAETKTGSLKTYPRKLFGRAFKVIKWAIAGWLSVILCLIVIFRFVNPPASALMLQQRLLGDEVAQQWVGLEDISPNLVRSVLVSEDGRFCQHRGVDYQELQNAIERSNDGVARGASTISMQVTKNMFLWPSKSYLRKAIEIPLTYVIEAVWNKRRIMEVYLNIAEWGPGIFGVEAASQFHFGKPARRLSGREAARLAVTLPNPYARDAGEPGPGTRRLAAEIQDRAQSASRAQLACVIAAIRP